MDIFSVFSLCGGLAFFLYGMHILSGGLEKLAGGKMKSVLRSVTGSRLRGFTVGAVATTVVQSSSAVTVMLIGLADAGILELPQAVAVMIGSNVGTTLTAWILGLSGVETGSVWLRLLQPQQFSPLLALVGALLLLFSRRQRRRDAGSALVGFALLMYGMTMMSAAVAPLAEVPQFVRILTVFRNPLLGVLAGAIFTAVLQSSSASIGVLQALSLTGAISVGSAVPLIMGQNIGTCVSALLATAGAGKNARRVAAVHVLFNSIGALLCLLGYGAADALIGFSFTDTPVTPFGIAAIHTVFNVAATILLLPASQLLIRLSGRLVRGDKQPQPVTALDHRLLTVPSLALEQAMRTAVDMARLAEESACRSLALLEQFDADTAAQLEQAEKRLDTYEDALGTYLVALSKCDLSERDAARATLLLHTVSDFERIGDHAHTLAETAADMAKREIAFPVAAAGEWRTLTAALAEILSVTVAAFEKNDLAAAEMIEPLEETIDTLAAEVRARHIARLQEGGTPVESGWVLTDLLTDCARISDHCSNVGVALLETARGGFGTHARLRAVKAQPTADFLRRYAAYRERYALD